jgi:hypothetical protein
MIGDENDGELRSLFADGEAVDPIEEAHMELRYECVRQLVDRATRRIENELAA